LLPGMKSCFSLLVVLLLAPLCFSATPPDQGILPPSFNGWQKDAATVRTGTDAAIADPTDASVLKEYGFSDAELATYTRGNRKIQVKAARFRDLTGAYGAFTFYQQPQMQTEKIGDQAASNNLRILFYHGNVLVDVLLDRVTAMSAADLRVLSDALPQVQGNSAVRPDLPLDLPRQSFIPHTERYIIGPVAMERLGVPLPVALVDFNASPELVLAKYRSTWGEANLTLIAYPTPQIAMEKLRTIQAAALPGGPFYFKRTGPILAVVNGNIPQDEVNPLLASVNYDANVTLTEPTKADLKDNLGNLIVGVFVLIGFIALLALIFGFAFGGLRILAKKLLPNRVFDRPDDVEIIRLNLK
jgi:hypothetical protein